jgi:hypothetical protein
MDVNTSRSVRASKMILFRVTFCMVGQFEGYDEVMTVCVTGLKKYFENVLCRGNVAANRPCGKGKGNPPRRAGNGDTEEYLALM